MTVKTLLTTMPIDIERFSESADEELTAITNAELVVRFLYINDDKAFTPAEIAERTEVKKSSIGTVLRRLKEQGHLKHKGDYWAIDDKQGVQDAFHFQRHLEGLDEQFGAEDLDEWREHAATNQSE